MSRQVYPTDEVAHLWAHGTQETARNPQHNLYFTGDTIYSYRDSYPIARRVSTKTGVVVLVQEDTYSNTTARHIHMVRQAVSHLETIDVAYVEDGRHKENLKWFAEEIEKHGMSAARARESYSRDMKISRLERAVKEANLYCEVFGLKTRFESTTDIPTLKRQAKEKTLAELAKKALDERKADKAARESIEKFRAGLPLSEIGSVSADTAKRIGVNGALLRLTGDRTEIETSKGVRIPVDHAKRGLRLIQTVRESGQEYQRNGHTIHLGPYAVDRIDTEGNLTAGCHYVAWNEIERIGKEIG